MVAVAVKLTGELAQVGLEPKVIAVEIVGEGDTGAMEIVMPELVALVGLAHVASEVIVQVTTSLLLSVVLV